MTIETAQHLDEEQLEQFALPTHTVVQPANGSAVTQLPIGLHAVAGRSDILIVVREPGATIDVIERMCPHYIGHPREPRKDLILYGDIARRSDGSCQLTCFHRNPAWDLPSGGSVLPSVQDIAVYSSALIDGQLLADLADWRRAA